jgi:hypothetical protein
MLRCALTAVVLVACAPALRASSFRTDVMAVLSRAGCNMGTCHGNLNGKGGFKLSLRGQDADADLAALTRDAFGRRVDPLRPDDSLVLQKATMALAHEGGQRFSRSSEEYRILRRWIAGGAKADPVDTPTATRIEVTPTDAILHDPSDRVRLKVTAIFSDGKKRDVTRLACFEPSNLLVKVDPSGVAIRQGHGESSVLVRYLDRQAVVRLAFVPPRPNFTWKDVPENNYIDKLVFKKLKSLRINPSELCGDGEFIRRAYLDALGMLPTADETRRFLDDTRDDKRARLIETLLKRDEFADFWALKWADLLRNEEKALDSRGVRLFHGWIRRAMIDAKPLNEFARELVASRGSSYSHPASNYYRALRDPSTRAEATAQVFLGVRLQCAKCHNHPFDQWTQTDYHRFGAFFARVQYRIVENNRKDRLDKHEFDGEQIIYQDRSSELLHPVTRDTLTPRFLGSGIARNSDNSDRLTLLADWIAKPDNPFFARAQANRIWQHLMGRGVVDPVDDSRDSNPPTNPELLDALAKDLRESKFDLRHLVRRIMNSRTYQLSSVPNATNREDESNFSRSQVRPIQAEVLLDSVAQVTGSMPRFTGFPSGTRAVQLPGVVAPQRRRGPQKESERFLSVFGKPVRSLSCECERGDDSTLAQAFQLITGETLNAMLSDENNRLGKLIAAKRSDGQILEELYLAALCRKPSEVERKSALRLIGRAENRREALEDVLWGLVNAKEFLLRR